MTFHTLSYKGRTSEGERALECADNNEISAPGKKSGPLRVLWEVENRTGAEVIHCNNPQSEDRRGPGGGVRARGQEDAKPFVQTLANLSAIRKKDLDPLPLRGNLEKMPPPQSRLSPIICFWKALKPTLAFFPHK